MIGHWLRAYWDWAGSNIGAMPGCGLVALAFTVAFRKPVSRLWRWIVGEKAEIEDIRRAAAAAHRIAADLYRHHTGEAHEHAPERGDGA